MFGGASAQNSLLNAVFSSHFSQIFSPSLTTSTIALPASNMQQTLPNPDNTSIHQQLQAASQFLLNSSPDFLPETLNSSLNYSQLAQQTQIRQPPTYAEAMVDQMNWQQNALLTSLSNSMMAASAAAIQSPDILRLRQVSLKDEEDLQQAVIAGLVGSGVAVREDCSRSTEEEELEDVNVDENSESEEQKQIEEEKRDEQPLDLSIRRNSKKKKALNRSFGEHPPPCTSTTPSPLRNSDFKNTVIHNGVLPQRSSCDIKRSASSVSHRANSTEPDVHDHFRRSLSGKWPRRTPNYAHPSPYYISNNVTNNSSLASLSSAQSISNILNNDIGLTRTTTLPAAQDSMELGETAIEQLKLEGGPEEASGGISSYLYWRKKSLSSTGPICNPAGGTVNFQAVANAPEMIDQKGSSKKSFNGMSNKANANRVETKIIINEGAKPVEDHFRKTFEMIKNGQLKSSENGFKNHFASPFRNNRSHPTSN